MRTDQGIGLTVMVGVWGLMSFQRTSILFFKLTYKMYSYNGHSCSCQTRHADLERSLKILTAIYQSVLETAQIQALAETHEPFYIWFIKLSHSINEHWFDHRLINWFSCGNKDMLHKSLIYKRQTLIYVCLATLGPIKRDAWCSKISIGNMTKRTYRSTVVNDMSIKTVCLTYLNHALM